MGGKFLAALFLAGIGFGAAQPLPELRTEATAGGSIFFVKNSSPQPVTAFLIELVNYPGSYYALWQDESARELIAPGAEKRIPVTNMIVGAVPDYVKLQAALFADGSAAGIPEKITQLVERRRFMLTTLRDLIARIAKAQQKLMDKSVLIADLQQWEQSLQPSGKVDRNSQGTINQAAARGVVTDAITRLLSTAQTEVLAGLRDEERVLFSSKPHLN